MNVSKFVLLGNGYAGITVEATETIPQGNMNIFDKVKRTRPFPIPKEIKEKIDGLKYFYLNLTRHWMPPFNKFFDLTTYSVKHPAENEEVSPTYLLMKSLLSNTEITGLSVSNAGFCIIGKIEVIDGKKSSIVTPLVTEEDDVSFFMDVMDKIGDIMNSVAGALSSHKVLEYDVKSAARFYKLEESIISSETEDRIAEKLVDKFQDRGMIVINSDLPVEIPEFAPADQKTTLHTSTGSIDSHNLPVAEEHVDEPEPEPVNDKKVSKKDIGKGTLASEKGFPILDDVSRGAVTATDKNIPFGGTLEDLEFSENLGIPREGTGVEQPKSIADDDGELPW